MKTKFEIWFEKRGLDIKEFKIIDANEFCTIWEKSNGYTIYIEHKFLTVL